MNSCNFKRKCIGFALVVAFILSSLVGCGNGGNENRVVIYTSAEDYRVEVLQEMLDEKFPEYDIVIEYMSTGDHAARLLSEGSATEADISYNLEYGYLAQLEKAGVLADVSGVSMPSFTDDVVVSKYYLPDVRNGGGIIINPSVLKENGLPIPTSYEDLLKPEYEGFISMPSPKSSSTGYMFLKSLVNAWGEQKAFEYFGKLTENILQYTSSGSGPVNALIQEEAAIGLGITYQAVTAINEGTELEVLFFEEGSPYSMYGNSIIAGKESRVCVQEVFEYIMNEAGIEQNKQFSPEPIYTDMTFEVENFPTNIKYADMSNNTAEEKTRLLDKWAY